MFLWVFVPEPIPHQRSDGLGHARALNFVPCVFTCLFPLSMLFFVISQKLVWQHLQGVESPVSAHCEMATKAKKVVASTGVLSADTNGGLPLWDEAHIHQENWGGNLGLPARKPGAVVDLRNTEQKIVVSTDAEQCELFRECIMSLSGIAGIGSCANLVVGWKRPAEIFAPFRPMVHRNMTPFLNPYDKRPAVYDSKEVAVASSGKKSDAKTGVPPPPLHVQYPEIVQVLEPPAAEMVVGEQSELMNACVVERYRELQPLMQAYDLEVELGCAATPAEACASRYSTALRHRLDQATALSKLSEPPPFVMSAFNTAIRFIEQQQSVIKSGDYLWELVYPHASDTCHPVYNPYGKYCVRLFIDGAYRQVTIDDYLPVDALGRPFFTVTSQKEIWPALVAKAIFIALGTSRHLLFTDPETIISCLFGEWVPERINPRAQPATACALLLGVNKESLFNDSTATHYSISTSQTPRRGMDCSESPLGHGTFSDGQARSGSRSAVSLARTCTLNADGHEGKEESDDTSAHVVCLVGTMPCETRKLFVVHNVVYFRNTLAIQISTNPPSTVIEAGMLTLDNKDEAVQELLKFSPYAELEHRGARGLSSQTSSTSMFWITLEELSEKLNILVWRKIGADSPFICHQRITSGESPSHPNTIKKRRNSTGPLGSTPPPLKRSVTRWMHITSEKAEKLAIVSLASPFPTVTAAAASAGSPLNSWSTAAPHTSYHSVAHLSDLKGCREVLLDLYNWDRGDVFSHSASFAYETGKLQCLVHDVPPGSHVFRLTTYGLEAQQVICVFATREFIFGEERDALRSANIFKVSDAGSHVSVDRVGEETVWFKRRFTLKEPTLISAVVTTLDPSEDPAAHRDIPWPAVKEPKAQKLRSAIQKHLRRTR
uniref:Putative calpain-like cysteine peptidase n=1 Tax=Trypanosoma vivax (strain Y486) TaxID=1055687 RepID=G0U8U1_TRYVY|nr:putative calpain-like cysteine peptidase [Trypanosoma vivax Y486]